MKKTANEIVDQMEKLPVIDKCYQAWWELQCQIEDFYSEKERQRPPLSEQKEFRSIKNAVIQATENIYVGKVTFEDEEMEEPADFSGLSYDCWELWMVAQDDAAPMVDRDEAAAQLIRKAEGSDPGAQYLVGKLYQDGPVLIPDGVEAQYWFDQSARQGYTPAQYALGKLYLSDDVEVQDTEFGLQWLEYSAHHGSDCASYRLGKEHLKGKIVERDITKAMDYLTQSAEAGNQYTQYTLGKLYLDIQDREQAHYWFTQSAAQGNEYAQFFLVRWDNLKPPSAMLSVTRLLHHMSRIFQEQMPTPAITGGIQIDQKRLAQLREKKIAMGHKADDHEEQVQSRTMSLG